MESTNNKMKTYLLLVTLLIIIFCRWSSASNTGVEQRQASITIWDLIHHRINDLWNWIKQKGAREDNVIGRCFGAARKLKFIMPIVIFKLGVIVTTLAFLSIFALKSLGLLVLLVIMNTSGWAAKLAAAKHEEKTWSQPQNVHLHVHQKKDGHFSMEHSEPSGYGWYDKMDIDGDEEDLSLKERLQRLNIYDSTYRRF